MTLYFYDAAQSRAIDRLAIEQKGIPGLLLMKRAGLFAFQTLQNQYPNAQRLLIVCGTGNNGGDGFVVAQLAVMAGLKVELLLNGQADELKNDALQTYRELESLGVKPASFQADAFKTCDVIIDALFGTGLDRPIQNQAAEWIEYINASGKPVIALDIPSGLSADKGTVLGCAVKANHTCTFITRKLGLYQFNGADYSGKVHYSPLFLEQSILETQTPVAANHPLKYWLNQLPHRPKTSHKGSAGSVCLIGGDHHMMGAIQMAGLASLKVGAGLVKVISHEEHGIALTQALPELICYGEPAFEEQTQNAKAIAVGPGLGLNDWGKNLFEKATRLPQLKVIDADALKLLAANPKHQDDWVLTPHPGEAGEMLGCTTDEIQQDRIEAVKAIQKKYGGVVVLKGNGSLIFDGENMEMCLAGNPGMAVGGMGDVLTGAIGGLIAQGLPLFEAACLGVNLHAHAGDILAQQKGQLGLLPTELASTISQLLTYADKQSG